MSQSVFVAEWTADCLREFVEACADYVAREDDDDTTEAEGLEKFALLKFRNAMRMEMRHRLHPRPPGADAMTENHLYALTRPELVPLSLANRNWLADEITRIRAEWRVLFREVMSAALFVLLIAAALTMAGWV